MGPITPKPCAFKSSTLERVNYFRGGNLQTYNIIDENAGNNLATKTAYQMSENAKFICQNGDYPRRNFAFYN